MGTFNKFRKIFLTPSLLWQLNMNWTCTTRHPLHPGKMDGRRWHLSFVQIENLNKLILFILMVILYREWKKAVESDGNRFMIIHDNCTMGIAVVHLEEPSRCKFPRVQPRQCLGESSGSPTVAATATRHHSGRTIHRPAPRPRHESRVWNIESNSNFCTSALSEQKCPLLTAVSEDLCWQVFLLILG